ncbi:MAG TPA: PAS domain-containing protein [Candidatus Methylacidiphilales bacterium]|nr:PAS domain-containing protein [Candidatus Methylacidiphilales bacterium]
MSNDFLLKNLLENHPDDIFFKDMECRFLRITPNMAKRLHLGSAEEALGKTDFDFLTPERAARTFEEEQEIMRTGVPVTGVEKQETEPEGTCAWVTTAKFPLRDNDGKIVGVFGISRDITAKKQVEIAFEKALQAAESVSPAKKQLRFTNGAAGFRLPRAA